MAVKREELKEMNFRDVSTGRRLAPVHPGEVLMKDFIDPMFGTDAQFWVNLQAQYDLETTEKELRKRIEQEVTPLAA